MSKELNYEIKPVKIFQENKIRYLLLDDRSNEKYLVINKDNYENVKEKILASCKFTGLSPEFTDYIEEMLEEIIKFER